MTKANENVKNNRLFALKTIKCHSNKIKMVSRKLRFYKKFGHENAVGAEEVGCIFPSNVSF